MGIRITKRGFCIFFVVLLTVMQVHCFSESLQEAKEYEQENLTVANPTPLSGHFFTGCWGNTTSDLDVIDLVHGYNLIEWDRELGSFRVNHSVVSGFVSTTNEEGDRNYFIDLYQDLMYSDETKITAWDYAFAILFEISPILEDLGGVPKQMTYIKGYDEYIEQQRMDKKDPRKIDTFGLAGVRVLNDYTIRITIKKDYLPYFYELNRLSFYPYPIHVIAPGCKVYDDGKGVYIWNEQTKIDEPIFTSALLEETVLNGNSGYMAHPQVSSGPYVLDLFDGKIATFSANRYYKGNEDGKRQNIIDTITYTGMDYSEMLQKAQEGKVDLLNKIAKEDIIKEGQQLARDQHNNINAAIYPRIGLTYFIFNPDSMIAQDLQVRRAIAYAFDKEKVIKEYIGDYGIAVDGIYGIGSWPYLLAIGAITYQTQEENLPAYPSAEWSNINLNNIQKYKMNIIKAEEELVTGGWVYNQRGEPYNKATDHVRYKKISTQEMNNDTTLFIDLEDGYGLVPLKMSIAYPTPDTEDKKAQLITEYLKKQLDAIGFRVTLVPYEIQTLAEAYNQGAIEEGIDAYYIGNNFEITHDLKSFFREGNKDDYEKGSLLWTHAYLNELSSMANKTEPEDLFGYMEKWVRLQEEISVYLPVLPVYGNVYVDIYTKNLRNYEIKKYTTWSKAIMDSYFSEPEDNDEDQSGNDELLNALDKDN